MLPSIDFRDLFNPQKYPPSTSDMQAPLNSQKHPAVFQCTLCPNRYTRAYKLRSHLRTHADELQKYPPAPSNMQAPLNRQKHPATFQCMLCPKRFTRSFNLKGHLRTHTDERPFVCTVCGKAFARVHDCKTHERLHGGYKEFTCKGKIKNGQPWGCGRRFARSSNLGRHFRSATGRHCIRPLLEEEAEERNAAERNATTESTDAARRRKEDYILDLATPRPQQSNAEHSAATTLTDIARTPDKGPRIFPGMHMQAAQALAAQAKVSQAAPSTTIYNSSTGIDWENWDRELYR